MRNRKMFPTLLFQLIFSIVMIIFLLASRSGRLEKAAEASDIWDNGIETTGTMIKGKQSLMDTGRTIWQIRTKLEYEVEGRVYETDCVVFKSDFKKLDTDKDDKVDVVLCYDAKNPSHATIEQGVEAAKKINKYSNIALWLFIVLMVIELISLPVARKLDQMS